VELSPAASPRHLLQRRGKITHTLPVPRVVATRSPARVYHKRICVHVYIRIYVCMRNVYILTYTCIHIHIYTYIYMYVYACIYTHINMYSYELHLLHEGTRIIHICAPVRVCLRMRFCVLFVCVRVCVYVCVGVVVWTEDTKQTYKSDVHDIHSSLKYGVATISRPL